ncbi:MAG: hypothetical protein MZV64_71880 [Ignavibacteriales bacterium]|nr:hypothetical protein [Ignavibacteriales bacterium]
MTFATERLDTKDISISAANYRDRKKEAAERLGSDDPVRRSDKQMQEPAAALLFWRMQCQTLRQMRCLLERNKLELNEAEFDQVASTIKPLLKSKPRTIEELAEAASPIPDDKVILALRWLIDTGKVIAEGDGRYRWD